MGSLGALRRGSLLTVVLLFAFLSLLLLLIVAIVDYVFQAHAFPGGFAIVVALSLFFILFEWLISPFIVRWAIRSREDRKSTRLNSSHSQISYAVFCLQ